MQITRLAASRCRGGESPVWDTAAQRLLYIDNIGRRVHSFDPLTGAKRTLEVPDLITALVPREIGGAVVALRTGIHFLDLESGALEPVALLPDPPPMIFNDAKADPRGRMLIGAGAARNFAAPAPDGGIYRLDIDHTLSLLHPGVHLSNGPCWSPDGATFYFSDSWLRTVYAYDYDVDTGAIAQRRIFAITAELSGMPDGATVDAAGRYWVAIYQGGKIAAFRSDGSLERTIDMPAALVSSLTFGGPRLDRLFVTTIAHGGLDDPDAADAGIVFVIDGLGAIGLPACLYGG